MILVSKDLEWLSRWTVEYHSYMDYAMGMVEDLDKLGKFGRFFLYGQLRKGRYR
jgi:hypothetical protein